MDDTHLILALILAFLAGVAGGAAVVFPWATNRGFRRGGETAAKFLEAQRRLGFLLDPDTSPLPKRD